MISSKTLLDAAAEGGRCKRKTVVVMMVPIYRNDLLWSQARTFKNGPLQRYDCTNEVGNCGCLHAETIAIFEVCAPWSGLWEMFSLYAPCTRCAHEIILSKHIVRVHYHFETPHDQRGLQLLKNSGVGVHCLP